ncbi:MAG: hypothetical protein LBD03_03935 [Methanobrevibacter sp.]|jgi:hypothetical protein|nr:hypothetical protein [Candidatus Methanovirga procula]
MKIKNTLLASLIVVLFVATTFSAVNAMPAKATHKSWDEGVWTFAVLNMLKQPVTVNIDGIDYSIHPSCDFEDYTYFNFTRDSVATYDGVRIPALITNETYPYLNCIWKDAYDRHIDIPECKIVAHGLDIRTSSRWSILGQF